MECPLQINKAGQLRRLPGPACCPPPPLTSSAQAAAPPRQACAARGPPPSAAHLAPADPPTPLPVPPRLSSTVPGPSPEAGDTSLPFPWASPVRARSSTRLPLVPGSSPGLGAFHSPHVRGGRLGGEAHRNPFALSRSGTETARSAAARLDAAARQR